MEQQLELARQFDAELVAADSQVCKAWSTACQGTRRDQVALRARDLDRVMQLVRTQLVEAMDYLLPHRQPRPRCDAAGTAPSPGRESDGAEIC